ncbi:hypothetical protein COCMIDRAFT_29529 [Bipolaris oryzae ATCC 44560]|uniref:Uncharacterized protein n=1 Tax=Bipolaris oryzae ATCC 44560 TaxID=930090 RepID=W6YW33_COCMI|nr:uncharacterized protein COCMIDRAFT_29529 [Bipolaris oryzae ATCC 44560]EUC41750.1 hypothetical protein COCMIDRAFT_29529 [Bipolaris oryzae ATCC 44560]
MSITHVVYYHCGHLRLILTHEHDGDECPTNMPDTITTPENCNRCMNPKSVNDNDGNSRDEYFGSDFSNPSGSSDDATDSNYDGDDEDDEEGDDEGDDEGVDEMLIDEIMSDNGNAVPARRLMNLFTVRSNPASVAKTRKTPVTVSLYDIVFYVSQLHSDAY